MQKCLYVFQAALSGQMEDGEVTTDPEFPPPTSTDSTPDASLEVTPDWYLSLQVDGDSLYIM